MKVKNIGLLFGFYYYNYLLFKHLTEPSFSLNNIITKTKTKQVC